MRVFGLTGLSGNGKTELLLHLLRHFTENNTKVSAIKHAHAGFDIDKPGKDSYRYREAGASEILVSSAKRWALLHENAHEKEADLAFLLRKLQAVDLILVEGFKRSPIPKLEVWRKANDSPVLAFGTMQEKLGITAIAAPKNEHPHLQENCSQFSLELLALEEVEAIAHFILRHAKAVEDYLA